MARRKETTLRKEIENDFDNLIAAGKKKRNLYISKKKQENPYRDILDQLPQGIVIAGKKGTILYSNKSFSSLLGVGDLRGKNLIDIVSKTHRRRLQTLLSADDPHPSCDINLNPAPRKCIRARISSVPVAYNGETAVAFSISENLEVSALKEALREVQKKNADLLAVLNDARTSERIYRAIGESINYGVWVCDPQGRNIYASPSFLEMVGMTQEECSDFGWKNVLHPDDTEKTIAAWQECVKTNGKWDIVHRYRGVDNQWHQVLARGIPVCDDNGKTLCWAGINLDISEIQEASIALKESEARFRAAQEASLDSFVIYTPIKDKRGKLLNLRIVYANRMMAEHYHTEPEKLVGSLLSDVLPVVTEPGGLIERHGRIMESGKAKEYLLDFEVDGVTRYFRNLVVPFGPYVATTFRDITETVVGTNALAEAKAAAERIALARSKFLATASHDLRQPVQTLVLLLAMLKSQDASPSFQKVLSMAENALEGLKGLMNSILNISRLDSGMIKLQQETVNISDLLGRLAQEYALLANDKGLRLRVVEGSLHIYTDPFLLERALRNLIENAIRYTERGGILIGARRSGKSVRIDVLDTGIGIPSDKQAQVFEEFFQIESPSHDQGLGLGLSIVGRIASLLGAEVQVSSVERRGSRFSLLFPLDHRELQQHIVPVEAPKSRSARILIIEDNVDVRTGLQMLTEGWGYETVAASSGEEALLLCITDAPFDVIMADHRLGKGLTGTETVKKLCAHAGRNIPSVIITGDTASEQITEIQASGFDVMFKPVGAADLRRKLTKLMKDGENRIPAETHTNKRA